MLQPLVFGLSPQIVQNHISEAALFVSQTPSHCTGVTQEDLINNRQLCKHDPWPISAMPQGTNKRQTSSLSSGL